MNYIINNATIVLRDEVIQGSAHVANGVIQSVDGGNTSVPDAIDFNGDFLLPGFVELHTDNLEQEIEPRPGVFWPAPLASVAAHDNQMIGAGITTVLDAVSLGEYHDGPKRSAIMDMSIKALKNARATGVLKADHHLHLRCEYPDPKVLDMLEPHVDDPALLLVSLMDHTPGQRQWRDTAKYRQYYRSQAWNDEEFERMAEELRSTQETHADKNRARIIALCKERNIPMAGHDDTTVAHIEQAVHEGIGIAEFPTTSEAARAARAAGIRIVMGGPNVVRGGSHSGNVSAQELAADGLLDILSSDYVPSSLVAGAFILHEKLGIPLPDAVATISANPAHAVGLNDRGEIAPGRRADLVRVRRVDGVPLVLGAWCADKGKSKARARDAA